MKLTFLGTGTAQGTPMIACTCEVCRSTNQRDKRLRTSALLQLDGLNILIDAGPDFRTQMLRAGVTHLDAILLTHEHKDHDGGLDDVRALNYFSGKPIDVWATRRVQAAIEHDYAYAFGTNPYPGAPQLTLHTIPDGTDSGKASGMASGAASGMASGLASGAVSGMASGAASGAASGVVMDEVFDVKGVRVLPVHGMHSALPVTGFRFFGAASGSVAGSVAGSMAGSTAGADGGDLAYLTDFNHIEESELAKLAGVKVLVINALAHNPHPTHFNLTQALEIAAQVGAEQTYLTHVSHKMGFYHEVEPTLPKGVHLAFDGLEVEV